MRKFRTAAVAVTSAVALTISGTAIASAQTPGENTGSNVFQDESVNYNYGDTLSTILDGLSSGKNSSQIGNDLGAWTEEVPEGADPVTDDQKETGQEILGSEKRPNTEWGAFWRDTTILGVIGTVIGAIIGLVNYAKFNGII